MNNIDIYKKDWDNICPSQELKNKLVQKVNDELHEKNNTPRGTQVDGSVIVLNKKIRPKDLYIRVACAACAAVAIIAIVVSNHISSGGNGNQSSATFAVTAKPVITKDVEIDKTKSYVKYNYNKEYKIDLDGDGKEDILQCSLEKNLIDEEFDSCEYNVKIDVNGKKCSDGLKQMPQIENYFFVTDIDKKDGKKEIVIVDPGMSDDPYSMIFSYSDNDVKSIGTVPSYPDRYIYNEDGTFESALRLSIFQTWHAMQLYGYNDGKIDTIKQKTYYPVENIELKLLVDLDVYTEKNLKSKVTTIKPQKCYSDELDNKEWVHLVFEDGTKGWIHMDGFSEITGNKEEDLTKIFDGLIWAD